MSAGQAPQQPAEPRPARARWMSSGSSRAGYTNKAIGVQLKISERTVQGHIASLFDKLGVNSRTELVVHAAQLGWVSLETMKAAPRDECRVSNERLYDSSFCSLILVTAMSGCARVGPTSAPPTITPARITPTQSPQPKAPNADPCIGTLQHCDPNPQSPIPCSDLTQSPI